MLEATLPTAAPCKAEFRFSEQDFQAIARMLRAEAGISLPAGKSTLVYARLTKRLRALGVTSFEEYVAHVSSAEGAGERRNMVAALTTNVTRFFREPHHFEHLHSTVLPKLLREAARGSRRIRLWSAACSSGQEAYSLAAVVADLMRQGPTFDIRILATDIDPVVLQQAQAGRYASLEGVPSVFRRWFEQDGTAWTASQRLRNLVSFKSLNLAKPWPVRGPFDAVLCRNVAIYFDADVQSRLWQGFASVIAPGGMLYIGHSERLSAPAADEFDNVGITTYCRRGVRR
ncbi:MAG: protein-glutamate O-methyltransferase [Acetobacteraceae bacterium]|nr:protein-glutamate O-methyltransferase [Acetobacteraceae bacterium]